MVSSPARTTSPICISLMSQVKAPGTFRGVVRTVMVSTAGSTKLTLRQHGFGLALEVEGHGDLDDLVEAHDHEVDMGDAALERIALEGT